MPGRIQHNPYYKQSCKEENMSTVVSRVHPDIVLTAPNPFPDQPPIDEYSALAPGIAHNEAPFPFMSLPLPIQGRIFELWLFKPGKLIHCMSRLDPFVLPQHFPSEEELRATHSTGLPRGFFLGSGNFNITEDLIDPRDMLRILQVNHHFHYIGAHCFYSMNTFAFSSLGEFSRFCRGIGDARVNRLENLEIAFMGNQYLTVKQSEKHRTPYSNRTHALYYLQHCRRLRTLVVHIDETGKCAIRRRYEFDEPAIVELMIKKTSGQPNFRKTRALRTVQGMDCIYQLRGMNWVRFYDLNIAFRKLGRPREAIRDWSFVEDVTNTSTMDKVDSRKQASEIKNLPPFFQRGENDQNPLWEPSADVVELVKMFFAEYKASGAFDDMRQSPHHTDLDIGSHVGTSARHSVTALGHAEDADDSDPDSSGDSFGGFGNTRTSSPSGSDDSSAGIHGPGFFGTNDGRSSSESDDGHPGPAPSTGNSIDRAIVIDSDSDDGDSLFVADAWSPGPRLSPSVKSEAKYSYRSSPNPLTAPRPSGTDFGSFLRSQPSVWLTSKRPGSTVGSDDDASGNKRPRIGGV